MTTASLDSIVFAAFTDELEKIAGDNLAGVFELMEKDAGLRDMLQSAGRFFTGGHTPEGIPVHGVLGQLNQGNPLEGIGSALAAKARAAGSKVKSFVAGGESPEGIPMHSLAGQLNEGNPLSGIGEMLAAKAKGVGSKAKEILMGGHTPEGIPVHGLGAQLAEGNPLHGAGGDLASSLQAARAPSPLGRHGTLVMPAMMPKAAEAAFAKFAKELTEESRSHIADKNFALTGKQSNTGKPAYPIQDKQHAKSALGFSKMHGTPTQQHEVYKDVAAKYPELVKEKEKDSNMGGAGMPAGTSPLPGMARGGGQVSSMTAMGGGM